MDNASAEAALSEFSRVRNRIEAQRRLSLTDATGVTVFFADPHVPGSAGSTSTPHDTLGY